jgi:hypothetical protein
MLPVQKQCMSTGNSCMKLPKFYVNGFLEFTFWENVEKRFPEKLCSQEFPARL